MESSSNKIKKVRVEKKLTQKELSELSSVSEVAIRKYEAGKRNPKIETLTKLADALQVPLDSLISDNTLTFQTINTLLDDWMKSVTDSFNAEAQLLHNYRSLNLDGKKEAEKRITELTELARYTEKAPTD